MSESLILVKNPFDLPWQTVLYDLLVTLLFIAVVAHAAVQFRRGTRVYALVVAAAFAYGIVLELAGMATLNMYVQGDFTVMLNFPAFPLFEGTTAMPSYVSLFYPVIFTIGYKIVESLGIITRWQAAVTGGLFMVFMDAPYIIEGNLRHVVWWTWDPDFTLFQLWVGWPLADMLWQATFGATFFYLVLRCLPHIDGDTERWSTAKLFGVAPLISLGVLIIGPVLMSPLTLATFTIGQQWPVVAPMMAAMLAVTILALRTAEPPRPTTDRFTTWLVGAYTVTFAAMILANFVHEGGLTMYTVVQTIGLIGMTVFASFPRWAPRRTMRATGLAVRDDPGCSERVIRFGSTPASIAANIAVHVTT